VAVGSASVIGRSVAAWWFADRSAAAATDSLPPVRRRNHWPIPGLAGVLLPNHPAGSGTRSLPGGDGAAQTDDVIRVYLLDDHEVVRRGLRELLEAEDDISIVGESGSAQEAVEQALTLRPDIAILDARLPDGNGVDVCRDIRSADPCIQALILTSYEDDEALFSAIMAGAAGYVLKQIRGNDLVDAVRWVAAGRSLLDPMVTQRVMEHIRNPQHLPDELKVLTEQERKILALVADGLTNRQIAAHMALAEKTVKNYVSSLLSKLGLERRTQAAVLAVRLRNEPPKPVGFRPGVPT